ncbi:MAG: hypothetical protein MJZ37_03775 [Bacilli bacterium]|nr:hypothetical protein [Bacilli bacterium]
MEVLLLLDFLYGPIQGDGDIIDGYFSTDIPIIDNDLVVRDLDKKISDLWCSFFIENSLEPSGFKFDELKAKNNSEELKNLCKLLVERLNNINDGTFVINNRLDETLERLK